MNDATPIDGPSCRITRLLHVAPGIAFFGHDRFDSAVIKRISAFRQAGARVAGFMFERDRQRAQTPDDGETVPLGVTEDRNYLRRLPRLALGLLRVWSRRDLLVSCDAFYARNIDMLLLAVLARAMLRRDAPVIYEALDIRQVFVGDRLVNRLFRWAERRLLAHTRLLVVSSPDYITQYFHPLQGYRGAWHLLENKVPLSALDIDRTAGIPGPVPGPPWVIGMFGVLKCARSLDLLSRLAAALPNDVVVHLRGIASESDIPAARLRELTQTLPNVRFFGPYRNPTDLAGIYSALHFVWAADFLDPTNNSLICLPNRLYEGCLFGAVALANTGTATARMIEDAELGWTLDEPLEMKLIEFFRNLSPTDYQRKRTRLRAASRARFVDEGDTAALLARIGGMIPERRSPAPP